MERLVVVDGANVVGSVPNGWWRDRAGAARRLRDQLARLSQMDSVAFAGELVLVVEGRARGVESVAGVLVISAPASGDDAIVEVVGNRSAGRPCLVVTADRGLRQRLLALGADLVGPGTLLREMAGQP